MQVLYRKYRSQIFAELYGQEAIKKLLQQTIKDQRVSHAYLFTGPRGTGKTSTARILAKALNCKQAKKTGEPCGICPNCKNISEGRFLDLIEIDAASNRGIDEIRDLKEKVSFLPVEGNYKVYIIDEVHMLTSEAFNALLKTLEEPPTNVVFILATTEPQKLPLTIISRTQRLDFKIADKKDIKSKLNYILEKEKIKFDEDALDLIVEGASGSYRDSETILEKVISSQGFQKDHIINLKDVEKILGYADTVIVKKIYKSIINQDIELTLKLINDIEKSGINLNQLIKQLLSFARNDLLEMVSNSKDSNNIGFVLRFINELIEASNKIAYSPIPELVIEYSIFKMFENFENRKFSIDNDENKNIKKKYINSENKESKVLLKEEVVNKWKLVLSMAKTFNHHLVAFLSKAQIDKVSKDIIYLRVPFLFHKKSLEQKRTEDIFSVISKKIFDKSMRLCCILDKTQSNNIKNNTDDELQVSNTKVIEELFLK